MTLTLSNLFIGHTNDNNLTFEFLMKVKMLTVIFQVVTPCSLVGGYRCYGGKCRPNLQDTA